MASAYRLARARRRIDLGQALGVGGEGIVFAVQGHADLVAKVYHLGKTPPQGKLAFMLANPPEDPTAAQGHCSIAWPRDLLHDDQGQTQGYAMPCIGGGIALHELYNPQSRLRKAPGFHWRYLHVAARNLASAVAAIHAKGYCIGDLNESNILVQRTALLTLVDTDSFQVPNPGGAPYLCPVGKPEYTAPEIQGQDFLRIHRNEAHDCFALAVLIFHALQEGSHPYRGMGPPPELGERIQRGLFPFAPGAAARPPPLALFDELAPPLRDLFRAAFQAGHRDPGQRPSARDWGKALAQAEAELVVCKANPQHLYHRAQSRCTWCARAQALGGFDPYPAPNAPVRPTPTRSRTRRPASPSPVPPRPAPRPTPAPRQTPTPQPAPATVAAPPRVAWGRRPRVAAFGVLAALVVGTVLYQWWSDRPAAQASAALAAARAALARDDAAAVDQALAKALAQDPAQVLAFAQDQAALYGELANRARSAGATAKADLAQAEATRWETKAREAGASTPVQSAAAPRQGPVGALAETFVAIPGGAFSMGCSPGDGGCGDNEKPAHQVTIKPFRMGKYEVTQAQWQAVMGNNPSSFKGDERPVESVTWNDIQDFLKRLNADNPGQPYRLPTEAEWEYAARAGSTTRYWWGGEDGQGNANCDGCGSRWDNKETAPVGSFKANAFGLYDTAGNVWEWVADCYHDSYQGAPADGSEWHDNCQGTVRVVRGGSWGGEPRYLRVSYRYGFYPGDRYGYFGGLRLAQDL